MNDHAYEEGPHDLEEGGDRNDVALLILRDGEFAAILFFLREDHCDEALLEEHEEIENSCRSKGKEASPV